MSTPIPPSEPVPVAVEPAVPVIPVTPSGPREIKLISHSPLFYWWPVWVFGFLMAGLTAIENNRFAVVPDDTRITPLGNPADGNYMLHTKATRLPTPLDDAIATSKREAVESERAFPTHVSQRAWMGSLYVIILVMTISITNVPLRGLWSFLAIMAVIVVSLLITVFNGWDDLYERMRGLKVYINMAGYLTISTIVFIMWAMATFVIDRRAYILFTPGQIKVCEHIGASVRTYDATGVTFEKQRDDLFRHYILGFGSGDLIVRTAGAEKHEIRMQNVLGIGWKLEPVEELLREKKTSVVV
ncbi:hypothetical protein [Limnoglobus roseus]|uniref:Uncharacterized protein n=1 Tax=Limnoglobus roseus TaxID=2598579 RepID=A0A5C1A5K2_9BACT|nr:hypothetical protein [Limnoglobus roseus]QEL13597.1 hypothetical protein PX52LOC_00455 [Limnoglobus roseus]